MNPQLRFAFGHELIVDLFAGGGGASEGIKQAFGRDHNNDRNAALRLCALKVAAMIGEGMIGEGME
jgi:hypothetical protein